jgi:DNA-binding beta-propeller fold protein YncE
MLKTNLVLILGLATFAACTNNGDDGMGGDDDVDPCVTDPSMCMRPPITEKGASTLAGWAEPGYKDGNRQINLFNNPTGVAVGPDGDVYVADFDNGKIRAVDGNGNATTVIAKTGFARPFGLAFVGETLYVGTDNDCNGMHDPADNNTQMSGAIWKVDINAKAATCLIDRIGRPRGLAALKDGRLGIADYAHHTISIFDPNSRTVTPLAGTFNAAGAADGVGAAATFNVPYGIVQRNDGKLVISDWANHRIRVVGLDGSVATMGGGTAGFADGGMAGARFNHPLALSITSNGDVYLADTDNFRVRKISADGSSVSTVAGSSSGGFKDSENALEAQFCGLEGVAVSGDGKTVYVGDGNRGENMPCNRVRVVKF